MPDSTSLICSLQLTPRKYPMSYRVHRINVSSDNMQESLENFINHLQGDLVSVIPNVRPTFQGMGATAKIDYILVVEKLKAG